MPGRINDVLNEFEKELRELLGTVLVKVILFGSYARGDYNKESDIDVMVLINVPSEQVSHYADRVYDIAYDIEQIYDIELNPCIQSADIYDYWKCVHPFFMTIEREGVVV